MQRVLGIIAEYNPLHLGHGHQLKTAIEETGADFTVIAMSGNFVQRGEPAIFDKWTRAEMALSAGADLVIEIPTWYVLQSAEGFARAGVALLVGCGVTDISFGSESGNISELITLAEWLTRPDTQESIREQVKSGISYPAAVQRAAELAQNNISKLSPLFLGSNNILAIEYLRALGSLAPEINVHTVKRVGAEHGCIDVGKYAGATAIRRLLADSRIDQARSYIPPCAQRIFDRALVDSRPVFSDDFAQMIFYALITMGNEELKSLPACSEGLENRIRRFQGKHSSLSGLLLAVKSKRYPLTRIQRLLFQAVLQFNKAANFCVCPPYIRVLGLTSRGKILLPRIVSIAKTPLLFSARDNKNLGAGALPLLELDSRAAAIYSLISKTRSRPDICRTPVFH